MSGVRFRGTGSDQDFRFADKNAKLLKAIGATAPKEYDVKINMSKVMKPVIDGWVATRLTEILGAEDEVLIGMVNACLQEEVCTICSWLWLCADIPDALAFIVICRHSI